MFYFDMSIMSSVMNPEENVQTTLRITALILKKTIVHFRESRSKMFRLRKMSVKNLTEMKSNVCHTRTREG